MNKAKILVRKVLICLIALSFITITSISISDNALAAAPWNGYAIYRSGVMWNLNDHAGLMDGSTMNDPNPVLHAKGYGDTVKIDSWINFTASNALFVGVFKPNNCTITPTIAGYFVAKARELRGIPYNVLDQIVYDAGSSYWVYPGDITHLRCDGVVEYVYEWCSFRVGGPDSSWDISRNLIANYWEHSAFFITPRKQHTELLTFVQSGVPN
jgi:hypothetical protein